MNIAEPTGAERRPESARTAANILPVHPGKAGTATLIVAPPLFFMGFDNPFGQAAACVITGLELVYLLLFMPPYTMPWRRCALPLLLLALALAWLPLVASVRYWLLNPGTELPVAPDLFVPKYLATLAGLWALLIGMISARLAARSGLQAALLTAIVTAHTAAGLLTWQWSPADGVRFAGLIGNVNVTASVCGVGCVLAWSGLLSALRKGALEFSPGAVVGFSIALALNLLALVLTASRVPSFLTILAACWLGALHWPGKLRGALFGVTLATGVVVIAAQSQIGNALVSRLDLVGTDAETRWFLWQHFLASVPSAFWTGYGSGSFSTLNDYTMTLEAAALDIGKVNSPHNLPLQLLLVGGLPYLLFLSGAAGLILHDIVQSDRWRRDAGFCALALAALTIFAASLVDIALDVPATALLFALLAGAAWGYSLTPMPGRSPDA